MGIFRCGKCEKAAGQYGEYPEETEGTAGSVPVYIKRAGRWLQNE